MLQQAIINCQNIKKAFARGESQVLVLRGIELEVFAGELLLLAGPSGCGNSIIST